MEDRGALASDVLHQGGKSGPALGASQLRHRPELHPQVPCLLQQGCEPRFRAMQEHGPPARPVESRQHLEQGALGTAELIAVREVQNGPAHPEASRWVLWTPSQ